jgi:PST family polysaccharide transporter
MFANRRADALLLGLFFGPVAVGLYRLADRTMNMLLDMVTRSLALVSLAQFSRAQSDLPKLQRGLVNCTWMSAVTMWPALGCLAATAYPLMAVMGHKWMPSAPVMQVLCVVGAVQAFTIFTGPLLQAMSRPYLAAWMVWGLAIVNTGSFVAVSLALRHQPLDRQIMGVAISRAAVFFVFYFPINLALSLWASKMRLWQVLAPLMPAAGAAAAAIVVPHLLGLATMKSMPPMARLLLTGACAAASAAIVLAFDRRIREETAVLWNQWRKTSAGPVASDAVSVATSA